MKPLRSTVFKDGDFSPSIHCSQLLAVGIRRKVKVGGSYAYGALGIFVGTSCHGSEHGRSDKNAQHDSTHAVILAMIRVGREQWYIAMPKEQANARRSSGSFLGQR